MPIVSLADQSGEITKEFSLNSESVIWEGVEDQGYKLPAGCLAGSCSSCKVEVLEGAENISKASAVEQNTLDSVYEKHPELKSQTLRLTCRAKILENITIRPINA